MTSATCDNVSEVDVEPVVIVPYDPGWPAAYQTAAAAIADALAPWLVEIEHVGSTAVPGLAAKPVIDIQIVTENLAATDRMAEALEHLGFEYVPELERDLPDRRFFRRLDGGRRTHQIHLIDRSNTEWRDRHLAFRDWLRAHDDDRAGYGDPATWWSDQLTRGQTPGLTPQRGAALR